MKYTVWIIIVFFGTACSTGTRLVRKTTADGGKIMVKKDFFSGIHYLYVEKKKGRRIEYTMLYDCECGNRRMRISKTVPQSDKLTTGTVWAPVTDTAGSFSFFGNTIDSGRLAIPVMFVQISNEEREALEEGRTKTTQSCCAPVDKPVNHILGFVKLR